MLPMRTMLRSSCTLAAMMASARPVWRVMPRLLRLRLAKAAAVDVAEDEAARRSPQEAVAQAQGAARAALQMLPLLVANSQSTSGSTRQRTSSPSATSGRAMSCRGSTTTLTA